MKILFLAILIASSLSSASVSQATSPSDILSAKVADEMKTFLPDHPLVHGNAKWYAPIHYKANGREIISGTALCVFRETDAISPAQGAMIAKKALDGFKQTYQFRGAPNSWAVFARDGVEEGEATAECTLDSNSDEGDPAGVKRTVIVTARFLPMRAGKFGILLHLTLVK